MLYIDCTDTISRNYATGIQRVVRRIVGELLTHHPDRACPVIAVDGLFYPLNKEGCRALLSSSHRHIEEESRSRRMAKRLLRLSSVLHIYVQQRAYKVVSRQARLRFAKSRPCILGQGDSVLLLDSFWGGPHTLKAAKRAKSTGAAVIGYIHDLIPLTHPNVMPKWQTLATRRAVREIATIALGIITTSKHCSSTVRDFLGPRAAGLPIVHNYHGVEFATGQEAGEAGSALMQRLKADKRRSYVMVGTIEPRKGHDVVLSAFERRWADSSDAVLIFVGRIGWAQSAFLHKLESHPERNSRLFVLNAADDSDLAAILRGVDAAIVASIVEGFGLPIVEALGAGLPLIASDIPVFREIAERHALFFAVGDPEDLATAIARFEAGHRQYVEDFTWPSWRMSAERLLAQAEMLSGR